MYSTCCILVAVFQQTPAFLFSPFLRSVAPALQPADALPNLHSRVVAVAIEDGFAGIKSIRSDSMIVVDKGG